MGDIRIIAGLGNPGRRYEDTRHNAGFMVLDEFARSIPGWNGWGDRPGAIVSEIHVEGEKVLLVKPLEYMNRSGDVIGRLIRYSNCEAANLVVVHDDIDLTPLALRVKKGGGEAGHNGLKSISAVLGSRDYLRVRLGVGRPEDKSEDAVTEWVLGRFSPQEKEPLREMISSACDALRELLTGGLASAQRRFNK